MNVEVENLLVIMPDSVRWDIGREELSVRDAVPIKTCAHSTYTFTSMPSMLTGLIPHRHGVYSPRHEAEFDPINQSLFAPIDHNTYIKSNRVIGSIFDDALTDKWESDPSDTIHLDQVEPPFVYVHAESGGHAPFDTGEDYESGWEFFHGTADASRDEYEGYYRSSLRSSQRRVEQLIDELEDRGLLESTLVVLTSDHGEHLHDYGGLVGHLHPVTPELVYVPTYFYHPELDQSSMPEFFRHVDLLPTAFDAMGVEYDDGGLDGTNALDPNYDPAPTPNMARFHPRKLARFDDPCIYHQQSLWDRDGGQVFNQHPLPLRLLFYVVDQIIERKAVGGRLGGIHPASVRQHLPLYLREHTQFESPDFSAETARDILDSMDATSTGVQNLDEATERQLEQLGYI